MSEAPPNAAPGTRQDDLSFLPEDQRQAVIDVLTAQQPGLTGGDATDHQPLVMQEEPLHIAIGSVDDVRALARDAAEARINTEVQGGGKFKRLIRRIWKGNTAREYYRQKYQVEAEAEIVESGNLYVHQGADRDASDRTMQTIVSKLTHAHVDELISHSAGESHARIDDSDDEQAVAIRQGVHDLISRYSAGELDDDNFEEEKNRVLAGLAHDSPELFGEGLMFADNLLEVAQNVRARVRHDYGVEDILRDARIDVGRVKTGVRTEARFGRTDEVLEALQRHKITRLFNENSVITAVSVAAVATKLTVQKGLAKAAMITGLLGVGGAVIAGAVESKRIKEDRRQHMRERAMGREFDDDAKRRQELEATRYETVSAESMISGLESLFEGSDGVGLRKIRDLTAQGFMDALGMVTEVQTRSRESDERSIDLVHFSDAESVLDERTKLMLSTIYAKSALEQLLEEKGGISWLHDELGLGESITSLDQLMDIFDSSTSARLERDILQRDADFKQVRREHVIRASLIGGTVGMVIGTGSQEIAAHLPGIGDNLYGIGEGEAPSGARESLINGGINRVKELIGQGRGNGLTGTVTEAGGASQFADVEGFSIKQESTGGWLIQEDSTGKTIELNYDENGLLTPESKANLAEADFIVEDSTNIPELSGVTKEFRVGDNTFVFPEEYGITELESGGFGISDQNGELVSTLELNPDGTLTDDAIINLREAGIGVTDSGELIQTEETITVPGNELVQNHISETQKVHRTLWYGNDTPAVFDLNELRTHAGGVEGSWFDADGNVNIDITAMQPDGSFWGDQTANPDSLVAEGRLSLAISATKDTQANVFDFEFTTTSDGRTIATIPPDSPVHQMFQMNGDQRVFNGAYFEIMEHTGIVDDRGEQVKILGTYVGLDNASNLTDKIITTKEVSTTILDIKPTPETIQTIIYKGNGEPLVEAAPVIPIYARRGLENTRRQEQSIMPPGVRYEYGRYGPQSPEEIDDLIRDTHPVLLDDPDARIPIRDAVDWYEQLLNERRGEAYVDDIVRQIESSSELMSMGDETEAIIAIPVSGINEGDNIFETLSLYGQQPEADQAASQIILHVNWPEAAGRTVEAQDKIRHTIAEIERAKAAFPGLNVTIVQSQITQQQAESGIIGHVVRKLFDTAILASKKAIDEGRMSPDHEVVLIRNDADGQGISPEYISRMTQSVNRDGVDAASGRIRWEIDKSGELPGLAVVMQIYEGIRGSAERARRKGMDANVETIGINTGVRVSTLAAIGSIGFGDYTGAGSDDLTVGGRIKAVRRRSSPLRQQLYRRRTGGALRGWSRHRRSGPSGRPGDDGENTDAVVIANGATIDSDVSRLEAMYRQGRAVTEAWGDYDEGGYQARDVNLPNVTQKEDVRTQEGFDRVLPHIEFQINSILNDWRVDPRHALMEFRRMFPSNKPGEGPMYELTTSSDGELIFSFTDSGKVLLRKRLNHNNTGQFDPIGSRRRRVNYGIPTANRSFPASRRPRLVEKVSQ